MAHICTPEEPYYYGKHGYDVEHPDAEFVRDIVEPRGAQRLALFRCRVCGTRFKGPLPEWAAKPLGVTPIERPVPVVVKQKLKRLGAVSVSFPTAPAPRKPRRKS